MSHIPPGFEAVGGELAVGGRTATAWVEEAGDTPLFLYDSARIQQRIAELRAAFPDVDIHYAVKANPMPELVRWMADRVDGLDVASAGELDVALAAGMPAERISFEGMQMRTDIAARAVERAAAR